MSTEEVKVESPINVNEVGGSSTDKQVDPNPDGGTGESTQKTKPSTNEEIILKKQYTELETKLGTQGKELGDLKNFFEEISPLLEELDNQPELVKAITEGKISADLVKAALEGKVSIEEAKTVTEAHKDVKKEIGGKEYEKATPEEIEARVSEKLNKTIDEKVSKINRDMQKNLSDSEIMRDYEDKVKNFVANTPDYAEYAKEINEWFQKNPDQTNITIAYQVVKGQAIEKKMKESQEAEGAEAKKELAANAGGGASQASGVIKDKDLADELVGGTGNPNIF